MSLRIFGLETEYALSAFDADGARLSPVAAAANLVRLAGETLPHLPGKYSQGIFLANGSRLYVDQGGHPELAICEVANPWDACRYILAGDRILADLATELTRRGAGIGSVVLTRCNIGYTPDAPTWGCHESYGHHAAPESVLDQLLPHLVSRVIYTGAGGFNNRSAGLEFLLSPRVAHLEQVVSHGSTSDRGILHTKDESLSANGYHRLHVICGESLCSQTGIWLKSAITALVVALIEAGKVPCGIRLHDPLSAMRAFAANPACTATAADVEGRPWTAIAIQRHILRLIEARLTDSVMPDWAPVACRKLGEVLDRLEEGPAAVAKTLDWAIKLALYREYAARRGVRWDLVERMNLLVRRWESLRQRQPDLPLLTAALLRQAGAASALAKSLRPFLHGSRLRWDDLAAALALREELLELDTRYSQLGEKGIFAALDRAGALDHRVAGVETVEQAVTDPPSVGRARLRGQFVRQFHRQSGNYSCDWTGVWDDERHRYLDLSDPLAVEENWQDIPPPSPRNVRPRRPQQPPSLAAAQEQAEAGRFGEAYATLQALCGDRETLDAESLVRLCRLCSALRARLGIESAAAGLENLADEHGGTFWWIVDHVAVHRCGGLAPSPEMAAWVDQAVEFQSQHRDCNRGKVARFEEHYGYFLMTEGRLREARGVLERLFDSGAAFWNTPLYHRAMAVLGKVYRRQGDRDRAITLVERAAAAQATPAPPRQPDRPLVHLPGQAAEGTVVGHGDPSPGAEDPGGMREPARQGAYRAAPGPVGSLFRGRGCRSLPFPGAKRGGAGSQRLPAGGQGPSRLGRVEQRESPPG